MIAHVSGFPIEELAPLVGGAAACSRFESGSP